MIASRSLWSNSHLISSVPTSTFQKLASVFFFVQISVFVRGPKVSSELIHLLLDKIGGSVLQCCFFFVHYPLDKTMALPEPRNRRTNPPNRPTKSWKCKTVFVDCQPRARDAAGRTLTRSDKDSVFKNSVERNAKPLFEMSVVFEILSFRAMGALQNVLCSEKGKKRRGPLLGSHKFSYST